MNYEWIEKAAPGWAVSYRQMRPVVNSDGSPCAHVCTRTHGLKTRRTAAPGQAIFVPTATHAGLVLSPVQVYLHMLLTHYPSGRKREKHLYSYELWKRESTFFSWKLVVKSGPDWYLNPGQDFNKFMARYNVYGTWHLACTRHVWRQFYLARSPNV